MQLVARLVVLWVSVLVCFALIINPVGVYGADEGPAAATTAAPLIEPTDCIRNETKLDGSKVCVVHGRNTSSWECVGVISGCALGGFAGFALGLPFLLVALGFGALGIVAASPAACFQSHCGEPCFFAAAQSAGMTGNMPMACRVVFGALGAGVCGAAGSLLPQCYGEVEVPYPA